MASVSVCTNINRVGLKTTHWRTPIICNIQSVTMLSPLWAYGDVSKCFSINPFRIHLQLNSCIGLLDIILNILGYWVGVTWIGQIVECLVLCSLYLSKFNVKNYNIFKCYMYININANDRVISRMATMWWSRRVKAWGGLPVFFLGGLLPVLCSVVRINTPWQRH